MSFGIRALWNFSKVNATEPHWWEANHMVTLVHEMAWCRQAGSHYLSQCWPRSMSPYDLIRPQGVKALYALWKYRQMSTCFKCFNIFINTFRTWTHISDKHRVFTWVTLCLKVIKEVFIWTCVNSLDEWAVIYHIYFNCSGAETEINDIPG